MVILIADDDRLVRFTIKSMLSEIRENVEDVIIEAANGQEMVKYCYEKQPDIAFVDIKMPYMDGLSAIAECKKKSEMTEYVIVSGYSDFEYAQRGIGLGIYEYLLKPVDEEQLQTVMENLRRKVMKKNQESNSRFQLKVMETFRNYSIISADEDYSEEYGTECGYLGFVLYVKSGVQHKETAVKVQRDLMKDIQKLGKEIVDRKGKFAIAVTDEGFPCVVIQTSEEMKSYILSVMRKIISAVREENKVFQDLLWFEGKTMQRIYQFCEKTDLEACCCMIYENGYIFKYKENMGLHEKDKEFLQCVDKLMNAWDAADGMTCNEIMNQMWRRFKEEKLDVNLKNISRYCSLLTGGYISGDSLKSFCRSLVDHSDQMYGKIAGEENNTIEQVKKYVQTYYMNDISISNIAAHYELTANYLSTIFHQKTGCKFIDYLTKVRMEAAKRLLLMNSSASVQDIALMVGYNSARHFSSLFQKTTGETPTGYRKKRV